MNRPEPRPEHSPVDLDFVEDPTASAQDRDDDAALAALVRTRLTALELPPSQVDVGALTSGAGHLGRARTRRRAAWVVAGAVAAAAAIVAVVVLVGGLGRPADRQGQVAGDRGGGGTATVPLRAGVPELPADEVARLEALQDPEPPAPPGGVEGAVASWSTPLACNEAAVFGTSPAVLDGLDTSGFRQECVSADLVTGGELGTNEVVTEPFLFRFYLPEGVGLDDVDLATAADRGVSFTQLGPEGEDGLYIAAQESLAAVSGGITTVTWPDASATAHRTGSSRTEITWVEPDARLTRGGALDVGVRAVVAADPVTAVRAAVGFRNQGGMQVHRGDDGSLLLVPTSPPQEGMQALTYGSLTRTEQGCLGLDQDAYGFQLVLWPYGTTWDASAETLTVPGEGTFRLGDTLGVGGGEAGIETTRSLLPDACARGKLWIASSAQEMPPVDPPTPASSFASASEEVGPWADSDLHLTAETLTADAYFIMRPPPPENSAQSQAKVSGELAVLPGGCLGISPDRAVIWPAGTTALADGSGVRMSDGEELRIGDELDGGGGYGDVQLSGRASACPGYQAAYLNDPPLR